MKSYFFAVLSLAVFVVLGIAQETKRPAPASDAQTPALSHGVPLHPQAVSGRASGGGAIQRARIETATAPPLFRSSTANPLAAGSYLVGSAGYFPTIDSAFNRLHADGIAGPVTLLLKDTLYAAPSSPGDFRLIGPIAGAGPASRITIRPADNVAVAIRGNGTAAITFEDVSYLTIDGIGLQGNTRLTVHTLLNTSYSWNDAIDLWKNCDHVVIQNLTASTDDIARLGAAAIAILGDASGVPDSCLISGVAVTSGSLGILVGGAYPSYPIRPRGNVLRGNHIGSPNDSLISRGVQIEGADGTIIENNHVENLRLTLIDSNDDGFILGINAYFCRDAVIRNNVVHNICATRSLTYIDGILLTGSSTQRGANAWVYNNMVYDIRNRVSQDVDMNGIGAWRQDSARIDYNSVYLSPTGSTFASLGSSALGFYSTALLSTARNNILVNLRQELSSVALAIWFSQNSPKLSDYNDLHVGQYDSSFVAYWGGKDYKSIDALHSDGKEVHSVSVMPPFVSDSDLHITNSMTAIADKATMVAGITTDIDGNIRPHRDHPAPDIGADEFEHPPVGVEVETGIPASFALAQNYPNPFNPSTTIEFELPRSAQVILSVYDMVGREVSVLVNETMNAGVHEVKFDASTLSSGVYFYRLRAGDFVSSKKLLLLK